MMSPSWIHELWATGSPWFVLAAVVGGVGTGVAGCVRRYQRHTVTRMILREARHGGRIVYFTKRGTGISACIVEVAPEPGERYPYAVIVPPSRELPNR